MTTRKEIIAAAQRYWRRDTWNNEYFDAAGYADFVLASRDAEIERLENQVQARDAELWGRTQKILQLEQQLAAEQAKNVELLEIAKKGLRHYENRNIAHGTRNPAAIALDEIAATPSDTSALEAIVKKAGEVMRERCRFSASSNDFYVFSEAIRAIPTVTLDDLKGEK